MNEEQLQANAELVAVNTAMVELERRLWEETSLAGYDIGAVRTVQQAMMTEMALEYTAKYCPKPPLRIIALNPRTPQPLKLKDFRHGN